ncbi:ABC transporter ATP-binding protein [uncultured Desulfuromonas sp.]|uniref:ABC transporter ATP-binding protein n=1 Tax=uncultured Desulfuromonas sp. TaxID=181013 RepID=UPI002632A495|nr:ABC transporter ATP-binding protein [uncultured Desulfuromonas sp.]
MNLALDIRHLEKSYAGVPAVRDLSLAVEEGEIFGLLGPNGAGKSTTINMVAGVTRIGGGSVEIFGHDNRRDYRTTRRLTGIMHQEIVIDNFFTIDRGLKIHSGYYGVKDDPAWRRMLIERLGLGPHLHKVMIKLSGGLKRRYMIAKALIHKPRLLILDEPTAGVDVELRHTLWDFVREINRQGTTILLTTHYLEEAEQMCGRIAIMNDGELAALEPTAQLVRRMGGRTLTVHLGRPLEALPAELAPYAGRLAEEGRRIDFALASGAPSGELLADLCRLGVEIADVETRQPSLEEAFLKLTGNGRGHGGQTR